MTDFNQTFENYKNCYDDNLNAFLHKHKDPGVEELDFIKKELEIWAEVEFTVRHGGSGYQNIPYGDNTNHNQRIIQHLVRTMSSDSKDNLVYKSRAILKFLDEKLEKDKSVADNSILKLKNNFDNVKLEEVYDYFKRGLVDKKYFSENDLYSYLKAAFEQKSVPKKLFKIKEAPTKSKIIKVFNEYYKNIAGKPYGKQKQYAALLGDYFEGYNTKNVSSNFTK
jgi:hypothetical protein